MPFLFGFITESTPSYAFNQVFFQIRISVVKYSGSHATSTGLYLLSVYKLCLSYLIMIRALRAGNASFSSLCASVCLSVHPFTEHLSIYVSGITMNLGMNKNTVFFLRSSQSNQGSVCSDSVWKNHLGCALHFQGICSHCSRVRPGYRCVCVCVYKLSR